MTADAANSIPTSNSEAEGSIRRVRSGDKTFMGRLSVMVGLESNPARHRRSWHPDQAEAGVDWLGSCDAPSRPNSQ